MFIAWFDKRLPKIRKGTLIPQVLNIICLWQAKHLLFFADRPRRSHHQLRPVLKQCLGISRKQRKKKLPFQIKISDIKLFYNNVVKGDFFSKIIE